MADEFFTRPYSPWLESILHELMNIDPVTIAMQMIDEDGKVYSCFYNASADDRSIMVDAMRDDNRLEWIKDNREMIAAILAGEDEDEGGEGE